MKAGFVDLHVHSNKSDGTWSPKELVLAAKAAGLRAVAVTDHDTIDGLAEAHRAGEEIGVEVLSGVELSTELEGAEVHVLGYLFDSESDSLRELFVRMQKQRVARISQMVNKLQNLGYSISFQEVEAEAGSGVIGRPHLARVLVRKGYLPSVADALEALLEKGRPGYVPRPKLTPTEAIAAIRKANGIPVIAHPGLVKTRLPFDDLIASGLLGIEAYYPTHNAETITHCLAIASSYGLVVTGGSDSHGPDTRSGHTLGYPRVPYETVRRLYDLKAAIAWK